MSAETIKSNLFGKILASFISQFFFTVAKIQVVLSVREPRSWYTSVTETIYKVNQLFAESWTIPLLFRLLDSRRGAGVGSNREEGEGQKKRQRLSLLSGEKNFFNSVPQ